MEIAWIFVGNSVEIQFSHTLISMSMLYGHNMEKYGYTMDLIIQLEIPYYGFHYFFL
jgi:hypothetical protein